MIGESSGLSELLKFHSQLRALHFAISGGKLPLGAYEEGGRVVDDSRKLMYSGVKAFQRIKGEPNENLAVETLVQRGKSSWRQMAMMEPVEDALRVAVANSSYIVEHIFNGESPDAHWHGFADVVLTVDAACKDFAKGLGFYYYGLDDLFEDRHVDSPSI